MQNSPRSARLIGALGALVAVVIGLIALRRSSSESEVPVAPGTWHPVD